MTDERTTLRQQADHCRDRIQQLTLEKSTVKDGFERASLSKQIKIYEDLESWLVNSNGYE